MEENEDQFLKKLCKPPTAWISKANFIESFTKSSKYKKGLRIPTGTIDRISNADGVLKVKLGSVFGFMAVVIHGFGRGKELNVP